MSSPLKLGRMVAEMNDIIEQTYYLEQKAFEFRTKAEKNKEKIKNYMGRRDRLTVKVDDKLSFTAIKNADVKIEFFPQELKKNLDKDIYKRIVEKEVVIKDVQALIKMLKSYGVPAKEFKNHIKVNETIDAKMVDSLIDAGIIDIDDVKGCYTAEIQETVRIRKN